MSPRDRSGAQTRADSRWTLFACVLASSLSFVEGSVLSVALAIRSVTMLGGVKMKNG